MTPLPEHVREVLSRKAEAIVHAFNEIGYDALSIGERDFAAGRQFLDELSRQSSFPLLAANLRDAETQQPLFAAHQILRRGPLQIGVFGLIADQEGMPAGLMIDDPSQTARGIVEQLRTDCHLIVALTHLGLNGAIKLAQEVNGIDVIVGGHGGSRLLEPLRLNDTLIVQADNRGQYMGRLDLVVGDASATRNALVPMMASIEDDMAIQKIIGQYKSYVTELESSRDVPTTSDVVSTDTSPDQLMAKYAGEGDCKKCHQPQWEFWSQTTHAHAYQTLIEKEQHLNPECIGCHTTGYRTTGGYWQPNMMLTSRDLRNVQCESCHGKGSNHIASPTKENIRRSPSKPTCVPCHTLANDPDFDFGPALKQIRCPSLTGR